MAADMIRDHSRRVAFALLALLGLAGCATRPVNPPIEKVDLTKGYSYLARAKERADPDNLVVLAFSGGGTRAAAFSYGLLEGLRDFELAKPEGGATPLLDSVGVVSGVSGGSFTALAYGLYGASLFDQYEQRFLKRDVQGELLTRLFSPGYWGPLSSTGWGRSELAADYYDEILFDGATYGDLQRKPGPLIVASATDISSGARFAYTQPMFDVLCSDLSSLRLSRAAASSSAVPVILSPVTIDNYGGTCGFTEPAWLKRITDPPVRPAARVLQELSELRAYENSKDRPYIHLVDGGVSDNLALRSVLDVLDEFEALQLVGLHTPLDKLKRIVVIVVNSLSTPSTEWDRSVQGPGTFDVLMQATGVPIDHYSFEAIELMRDTAARWAMLRKIRDSGAISDPGNPALVDVMRAPNTELYVVNVSFAEVRDKTERNFLNSLPTSFVLSPEAVDRLRQAAQSVIAESPEFRRFLRDAGGHERASPAERPAGASPNASMH